MIINRESRFENTEYNNEKNKSDFIKFLLDDSKMDAVFPKRFYFLKVHKELYDERFVLLFYEQDKSSFKQSGYSIGGYFDTKEKNVYNVSEDINQLLLDNNKNISIKEFNELGHEMLNVIDENVTKYALNHKNEFKEKGMEKYNQSNDWKIDRMKEEVNKFFIKNDLKEITFVLDYADYIYKDLDEYYNYNMHREYLKHPKSLVKECSEYIIQQREEEIGEEILKNEYMNKYLKDILENKTNKYNDLYVNKNILSAIKDVDAKTLTITINYGGKEFTFKFDYNRLKCNLELGCFESSSYGVNYEKVSDFIKENSSNNLEKRYKEEFAFSHITSIKYGKKELYNNESLNIKNKEKEIEDFELEI